MLTRLVLKLSNDTDVFSVDNIQERNDPLFLGKQVLNRREAKSRLKNLTPDTEEHCKLQNALIRTAGIVEISLPTTTYKLNTYFGDQLLGGFGSSEHVAIGEKVKLKGLPENVPLFVKGKTPILFQHIIALAGDFYGVAGEAISLPGGTDEEKTERFKKAFSTLAKAGNENEVQKILSEIDSECTAVKHSSLPHHCYSSQMIEKNNAIKKIKNDIYELLADNSDHFSTNAEDAYRIGHTLALREAEEAGKRKDVEGLKRAYALDAFACHFLTDLFAAGHIRNQRGELEIFLLSQLKFSVNWAKKLAGILTGAQHEKDGNEGLNVSNQKGDQWRVYGDGHFFAPKNAENRGKVITATQQSVDEIHQVYMNPTTPISSTVNQLIPHSFPSNFPPLYSVEGTSLFLHQESGKVEIKTQSDYLNQGLSQALRYLPEKYINGFISPFNVEKLPILDKIVIPQIGRLTGSVWRTLGLATYHQVRQESEQLNEKIDELADTLKATFENSAAILQINDQLKHLSWTSLFQEIKNSIAKIEDVLHQYEIHSNTFDDSQLLEQAKTQLWAAYVTMSRIFRNGSTGEGLKLLLAYETMLKNKSMSPLEIKIASTLWFRQILDYQVQAFRIYLFLQAMNNDNNNKNQKSQQSLQSQVLSFESDLLKQIQANQEYIDETLIYENQKYISLQLEKIQTKQLAVKYFKTFLNKEGSV